MIPPVFKIPGEKEVTDIILWCALHISNIIEINFHILRRFLPSIQLFSQMQAAKSNDYLNYNPQVYCYGTGI